MGAAPLIAAPLGRLSKDDLIVLVVDDVDVDRRRPLTQLGEGRKRTSIKPVCNDSSCSEMSTS